MVPFDAQIEAEPKRFLRRLLLLGLISALCVCVFNVLIDPYGLFATRAVPYVNAHKVAAVGAGNERLFKRHDISRARPNRLILGDSIPDRGFDGLSTAWPAGVRPVYNLGLPGIDLRGSLAYVKYASTFSRIDLVIVAISFEEFLGRFVIPLDQSEIARLEGTDFSLRDLFRATASFNALSDSMTTLIGNLKGDPTKFVYGSHFDDERFLGTRFFELSKVMLMNAPIDRSKPPSSIDDLRSLMDFCRSKGAKVVVVITPVRASLLETYDMMGYWQQYESWKRDIAYAVDAKGPPSSTEFWDFSGYDKYSTSEGADALLWFLDSSHFTKRFGDLIVQRLFDDGNSDLGTVVTGDNVEAHLRLTRERRQLYREAHPASITALRRMYRETQELRLL